jgi:phospholipase/carboxylesterase
MMLNARQRAAKSGQADSLVVFLHGYGADGADLLGLADPLAQHLPNTAFAAPDAPTPCVANPMGWQWFPIPWLDGASEEEMRAAMAESALALDAWLDHAAQAHDLGPERIVIVGFSQGTMMALHVLPRRAQAVAGIVGFSGRLLDPAALASQARARPPVLLVHGDADEVVPPDSLPQAAEALTGAGFEVYTHMARGLGHGIDPEGLGLALQFVHKVLARPEAARSTT